MMSLYARIVAGIVFETFETDEDITALFPSQMDWVACADDVQQGWVVSNGSFVPPPPAAPPPITFTPRAFIETLFTPAEQQAIYTAAQQPQGWQIAMFISLVAASPVVNLSSPELIKDIGIVQAAGILTASRAAQILAGTLP